MMKIINLITIFIITAFLSGCNTAEQEALETVEANSKLVSFEYNISDIDLYVDTTNLAIVPRLPSGQYSYSINPGLPSGLYINRVSGEIYGTPSVAQSQTEYIVTATDRSGDQEFAVVTIEVIGEPPKSIRYSSGSLSFNKDTPGSFSVTSTGGTPDYFTITPALPAGLTLDPSNGDIGGTPLFPTSAFYTITAANTSGSTSTTVLINVDDVAPTGLSYTNDAQTINVASTLTSMVPSLSNSPTSVSYKIFPKLPAGLSLDTNTGVISGTPTEANGISSYTVTAYNVSLATGDTRETTVIITLTVNDPARSLDYGVASRTVEIGETINDLTVQQYLGSTPVAYSCALCSSVGLNINSTTGKISGTINSGTGTSVSLVVQATDQSTLTTVSDTIVLQITEDAPTSRSYIGYQNSYEAYTGNTTSILPSSGSAGGTPSAYTISPDITVIIPGLSINALTGEISGTPTDPPPLEQTFVVRGTNVDHTGGANIITEQTIKITLKELAPKFDYPQTADYNTGTSRYELSKGVAMITLNPNYPVAGRVATSFTVSPNLPDGLSLNTSTGAISGTPTKSVPVRLYTITGSNTAGSHSETIAISSNTIVPITSLSYNAGTNNLAYTIYTYGTEAPTLNGTPGNFTVSPALPNGLYLNQFTGEIYGTPLESQDNGATATAYNVTITATNANSSHSQAITITVANTAPNNLQYATTAGSTNFSFVIGDIVNSTNIVKSSDADTQSAGFITNYIETPPGTFDLADIGLTLNAITGEISGTVASNATYDYARDLNPQASTLQITGSNYQGTSLATLTMTVTEPAPNISYNNGTNTVTIQGDNRNNGGLITELPQTVSATNTGGEIALNNGLVASTDQYCTVTTVTSVEGESYDIFESYGSTGVSGGNNTAMPSLNLGDATPAASFQFDGTTCSFRFNKNRCFSDDTNSNGVRGDSITFDVLARNSGNTTGVTTRLTVHMYDGPNFNYRPDETDYADDAIANLDGTSASSSYAPDTTNRCHQGDYSLSNSSDLPSPLSFDSTNGEITTNSQLILGRRSFTLSATETNSGMNLSQSENILLQASHIETNSGNANHKFEVTKFDFNFDGYDDLLVKSMLPNASPAAISSATTSIYLSSPSTAGLFEGTVTALPVQSTLGAIDIAPIIYDSNVGGILYTRYDGANFDIHSLSTTNVGESTNVNLTTSGTPHGVVPLQASMTANFGVVIDNGSNQIAIDQFEITGNDLNNVAANGTTPTVLVSAGNAGGISLRGTVHDVKFHDFNDDGLNDAVVTYTGDIDSANNLPDSNPTSLFVCVLPGTGTNFSSTCAPRLEIANSSGTNSLTDIKFANISGDSLDDIIVLYNDTATGTNSLYIYENRNNTFAGLFQQVEVFNLNTTPTTKSHNVRFDLADINNDSRLDLITNDRNGDINGDSTNDNIISGFTTYTNTGVSGALFNSTNAQSYNTELNYHNSGGDANDIEMIEHGSQQLLLHCQTDTETVFSDERNSSCGIMGSF